MDTMKTVAALLIMFPLTLVLARVTPAQSGEAPPAWAYPVNPPDFKLPPDDGALRRGAGSNAAFTLTQLRDRFFAPDCDPGDHPPVPAVVYRRRTPAGVASGL